MQVSDIVSLEEEWVYHNQIPWMDRYPLALHGSVKQRALHRLRQRVKRCRKDCRGMERRHWLPLCHGQVHRPPCVVRQLCFESATGKNYAVINGTVASFVAWRRNIVNSLSQMPGAFILT